MVRKQLYIGDGPERALKARARELGVSEAELVRRMLDGLLLDGEGGEGLSGLALRRPWRAFWRGPTSSLCTMASPMATGWTGRNTTSTVCEVPKRMTVRYLVGTNLLAYALDRRAPEKHERAREMLQRVGGAGIAALPAQVLSEFVNACLRKLEPRPDPATIRREIERLLLAFTVLPLTAP